MRYSTQTSSLLLVRDVIKRSLYDPRSGYFSPGDVVLQSSGRLGDFRNMRNENDYRGRILEIYEQNQQMMSRNSAQSSASATGVINNSKKSKERTPYGKQSKTINPTSSSLLSSPQTKSNQTMKKSAWLTPTEIFKPYFSHAIGKWIVQELLEKPTSSISTSKPINILEIGGGNGTNALHLLNFIRDRYPEMYNHPESKYILLEISPGLARAQSALMKLAHPKIVAVINQDALEWNYNQINVDRNWFVILSEVLDNLPHDKIYKRIQNKDKLDDNWHIWNDAEHSSWFQTKADIRSEAEFIEPIIDPLIYETAKSFLTKVPLSIEIDEGEDIKFSQHPAMWVRNRLSKRIIRRLKDERNKLGMESIHFPNSKHLGNHPTTNENGYYYHGVFIPTGAMKLLLQFNKYIPKHQIIASDFNVLPIPDVVKNAKPNSTLRCLNSPIVAGPDNNDFDTYILGNRSPTADIFFATDFRSLLNVHNKLNNPSKQGKIYSFKGFSMKYSNPSLTRTITGYNPMLEDFINVDIMTT